MTKFNVEIVTERLAAKIVALARIFPNNLIKTQLKLSCLPYRKFHASRKIVAQIIRNILMNKQL